MKKPITVKVLVAVTDMAHFEACTLCFETLRVGWPTAMIEVYVNGGAFYGDVEAKLFGQKLEAGPMSLEATKPILQGDWVRAQVEHKYPGPLVIADPDIVYWKSCEDWEFPAESLLAGYYNPRMWNDYSKCISVARIHTSMMAFPDTENLRRVTESIYPYAFEPVGEYCQSDPFLSRVMFEDGKPVFWDGSANLYQMLLSRDRRLLYHFGEKEKSCFDHLNSPSSYAVMCERLDPAHRGGFITAHRDWVKNPTPGLWPLVDEYYKQKEIEGWVKHPGDRTLKV